MLDVGLTMHVRFPLASAFSILAASCADSESNSGVFDVMRAQEDVLFYMQLGDLHYDDIEENDVGLYADAYETVMAQSRQRALYAELPIVYMWDDHDFGPNNARKDAEGREAARLAYQHYVPHYPLPTSAPAFGAAERNVAVYHSFAVGDVYFIVTDGRSEKSSDDETDASKSVLGLEQKAWFKREIVHAVNDGYSLIVWSNGVPWISRRGGDTWAGFEEGMPTREPRAARSLTVCLLAQNVPSSQTFWQIRFRRQHRCSCSPATHTWSLWTTGGTIATRTTTSTSRRSLALSPLQLLVLTTRPHRFRFVVVQAAALDRSPSVKGGPYSHGCFTEKHQFVRLDFTPTVVDGVNRTCVDITAIRGEEGEGDEFFSFSTCNPSSPEEGVECEAPLLNQWEILALCFLIVLVLSIVACVVFFVVRRRRAARLKLQKDGGVVEMEPQTPEGPASAFLGVQDCRQRGAAKGDGESSWSSPRMTSASKSESEESWETSK